jgi:hypothetical protein
VENNGGISVDMEGNTSNRPINGKNKVSQLIVGQIKRRKKIAYGLWDAFKHSFLGCCCQGAKDIRKKKLFQEAMAKIDKELDIRHINNELRTLKFIANILLTKY